MDELSALLETCPECSEDFRGNVGVMLDDGELTQAQRDAIFVHLAEKHREGGHARVH